jgi:myo-inositol-1(or 4)-monophosphatase
MDISRNELQELMACAQQAILSASEYLLDRWGKTANIRKKSLHKIVIEEDLHSEEMIISSLEKALPEHSFISEECGGMMRNRDFVWVIDPLDGTSYYARGLKAFSISITFLYKWQPVLGLVTCPADSETFTAMRSSGALLNGEKIVSSSISQFGDSIVSYSHRFLREPQYLASRSIMIPGCRSIRGGGACAQELCYVACGRIDGFIAPVQKIWDFAAGGLILEEAGGRLTDFFNGNPNYAALLNDDFHVAASNNRIHDQILGQLNEK